MHRLLSERSMRAVKRNIPWVVICIWFLGATLAALRLFLADSVNASTGIHIIIDSPVGALPTVGEWARNFLKTRIERQVMAHRVLQTKP
jgi:hypothetical protein